MWENAATDLQTPTREIVHSHEFSQYLSPFKAVWNPQDHTERIIMCGRYISEDFNGLKLHPIDLLDVSGNSGVTGVYTQLVDPFVVTISPVTAFHPSLPLIASGSGMHLYLWQPDEVLRGGLGEATWKMPFAELWSQKPDRRMAEPLRSAASHVGRSGSDDRLVYTNDPRLAFQRRRADAPANVKKKQKQQSKRGAGATGKSPNAGAKLSKPNPTQRGKPKTSISKKPKGKAKEAAAVLPSSPTVSPHFTGAAAVSPRRQERKPPTPNKRRRVSHSSATAAAAGTDSDEDFEGPMRGVASPQQLRRSSRLKGQRTVSRYFEPPSEGEEESASAGEEEEGEEDED